MKRREFCKTVPCVALSAICPATPQGTNSNERSIKEASMSKTITAVQAKVISQKGSCALGHKIGDVVEFTGYKNACLPRCIQSSGFRNHENPGRITKRKIRIWL